MLMVQLPIITRCVVFTEARMRGQWNVNMKSQSAGVHQPELNLQPVSFLISSISSSRSNVDALEPMMKPEQLRETVSTQANRGS